MALDEDSKTANEQTQTSDQKAFLLIFGCGPERRLYSLCVAMTAGICRCCCDTSITLKSVWDIYDDGLGMNRDWSQPPAKLTAITVTGRLMGKKRNNKTHPPACILLLHPYGWSMHKRRHLLTYKTFIGNFSHSHYVLNRRHPPPEQHRSMQVQHVKCQLIRRRSTKKNCHEQIFGCTLNQCDLQSIAIHVNQVQMPWTFTHITHRERVSHFCQSPNCISTIFLCNLQCKNSKRKCLLHDKLTST